MDVKFILYKYLADVYEIDCFLSWGGKPKHFKGFESSVGISIFVFNYLTP